VDMGEGIFATVDMHKQHCHSCLWITVVTFFCLVSWLTNWLKEFYYVGPTSLTERTSFMGVSPQSNLNEFIKGGYTAAMRSFANSSP